MCQSCAQFATSGRRKRRCQTPEQRRRSMDRGRYTRDKVTKKRNTTASKPKPPKKPELSPQEIRQQRITDLAAARPALVSAAREAVNQLHAVRNEPLPDIESDELPPVSPFFRNLAGLEEDLRTNNYPEGEITEELQKIRDNREQVTTALIDAGLDPEVIAEMTDENNPDEAIRLYAEWRNTRKEATNQARRAAVEARLAKTVEAERAALTATQAVGDSTTEEARLRAENVLEQAGLVGVEDQEQKAQDGVLEVLDALESNEALLAGLDRYASAKYDTPDKFAAARDIILAANGEIVELTEEDVRDRFKTRKDAEAALRRAKSAYLYGVPTHGRLSDADLRDVPIEDGDYVRYMAEPDQLLKRNNVNAHELLAQRAGGPYVRLAVSDPENRKALEDLHPNRSLEDTLAGINTIARAKNGEAVPVTGEALRELGDGIWCRRARRRKIKELDLVAPSEEAANDPHMSWVPLDDEEIVSYGVRKVYEAEALAQVNGIDMSTARDAIHTLDKARRAMSVKVEGIHRDSLQQSIYSDGTAAAGATGFTPFYAGKNGGVSPKNFESEFGETFQEAMRAYPTAAVEAAHRRFGDKVWLKLPPQGRGAAGYFSQMEKAPAADRRKLAKSVYDINDHGTGTTLFQAVGEPGQRLLAHTSPVTAEDRGVMTERVERLNEQLRSAREHNRDYGSVFGRSYVPDRPLLKVEEILVDDEPRLAIVEKTAPTAKGKAQYMPGIAFDSYDTAVHEIGHMMEYTHPDVQVLAGRFVADRSDGLERANARRVMGSTYTTVTDSFYDKYVSRTYADGATEVVSMGMEALFGKGRHDRNAGGLRRCGAASLADPEPFDDPGHRNFILGALELMKGEPAGDGED